jgi:hypothetical protein
VSFSPSPRFRPVRFGSGRFRLAVVTVPSHSSAHDAHDARARSSRSSFRPARPVADQT